MPQAHYKKRFLFVMTSHDKLGDTGDKTGFHFVEMSDPYYILQDHGITVDLASVKGGQPPADPDSVDYEDRNENEDSVNRFLEDASAMKKLKSTMRVAEADIKNYDGVYLPGGLGAMWDFPDNKDLQKLLQDAWRLKKIVGAVCHGPAAFVGLQDENGVPLVRNRRLNCFTNDEEEASGKDDIVPFLLETRLRDLGAVFEKEIPFQGIVVEDSHLITGQNPKSASLVANAMLNTMGISPYGQAA